MAKDRPEFPPGTKKPRRLPLQVEPSIDTIGYQVRRPDENSTVARFYALPKDPDRPEGPYDIFSLNIRNNGLFHFLEAPKIATAPNRKYARAACRRNAETVLFGLSI